MESNKFDVVVFGSCNVDLITYTPRFPQVGETIHGTNFEIGNGGKGANQCVAAAKLGASTALISRLGNDTFGKSYLENLNCIGVNTDHVIVTENVSTGMAQITVTEKGENQIVIVAGANNKLCVEDAQRSGDTLLKAKVVLFQLETPLEGTKATLEYLRKHDGPVTILNAAPAETGLDEDILKLPHILCVNESEAEMLTGVKISSKAAAAEAIDKLHSRGCNTVLITLGEKGSAFKESAGGNTEYVPVEPVNAVDTTGAGDAFLGGLAYFIAKMPQLSFYEKVRRASAVATYSVLKKGTQISFPTKEELPRDLFK
ncbi:hypothetical protein O3M35_000469 [Rhynocoris fuscipes]|uniref:Ribokinase n=1 Tax=Rhynocoris fuscipes TaxID=488301 RepID=A0AAW1DRJ6_9HEMI